LASFMQSESCDCRIQLSRNGWLAAPAPGAISVGWPLDGGKAKTAGHCAGSPTAGRAAHYLSRQSAIGHSFTLEGKAVRADLPNGSGHRPAMRARQVGPDRPLLRGSRRAVSDTKARHDSTISTNPARSQGALEADCSSWPHGIHVDRDGNVVVTRPRVRRPPTESRRFPGKTRKREQRRKYVVVKFSPERQGADDAGQARAVF